MTRTATRAPRERGAVLVVALIMLVLITVVVASSFTLTSTDLKSVTNTQFHDEAVAAANDALEQVISSPFTTAPASQTINVDINNDGVTDYVAAVATPTCVSASTVTPTSLPPSSLSLGSSFSSANQNYYDTVWDIDAVVSDPNGSGASAEVHEGVRVLLDQVQYAAVCP